MMLAEALAPRRARARPRRGRWLANISLVTIDTLLVRVVAPAGLTGLALYAQARGWGLLPRLLSPLTAQPFVAGVAAFVVLDFVIYAQHVAMHRVPILWRMHRVHHCDADVDTTTGVRFHPFEILVSLGIKAAAIVALGAPAAAVLVFEIVLNGSALFNHANWRLSPGVDRLLRLVLVTPDMHRVHHSTRREEQDSNFGFSVPWWDRLCGTYRARPADAHETMGLGVSDVPDPGSVPGLLRLPLVTAKPAASVREATR